MHDEEPAREELAGMRAVTIVLAANAVGFVAIGVAIWQLVS